MKKRSFQKNKCIFKKFLDMHNCSLPSLLFQKGILFALEPSKEKSEKCYLIGIYAFYKHL